MPIEQIAPELVRIVAQTQQIEELGRGYSAESGAAEGPLWWREGSYLLFSDIGNNRRMKWEPREGVTVFHEPTNNANGLTRDPRGRLIACEHRTRRVTRFESDGSVTVVANRYRYRDRPLNRPNDVVARSDGSIYFTDPEEMVPPEERELDFSGVYRVSPDLGTITLLGRVHTKRSTSKMSANEMNPRKITSSFSKREKMRRNPFNRRNSLSISLRLLYISRSYSHG